MPETDAAAFAAQIAGGHEALQAGRTDEAVRYLTAAATTDPNHPGAQHLLGIALERQGNARAAIAALLRVLHLSPGQADAALRAAGLLAKLGDRQAAANVLFATAASGSDPLAASLCRARAFGVLERHEEAGRELRAIVSQHPSHAEAWRLLGNTLSVAGEMAQARAAFRRAVELDPRDSAAILDLVRCGRVTDADRALVEGLARHLQQETASPRQRMLLGFALGKAYDDLNEPAKAIHAFDEANAIRARLAPFDPDALAADVDRIIAAFPAPLPYRADAARAVFIVGMPRSGTTLVEQILSCHPDVAAGGEMPFWGMWGARFLANAVVDASELRAEHARALDAVSATAARVIDKNPFNFAWLGLIRQVLPDATIIHCRRDPRDTCLSAYMTPFSGGNAWAASREGLVFFYGQYVRLMAHWRSVLPAQRFLEVDYETVAAHPDAAARQLVAFCDLPWNDACLRPEANTRPVQTASVYQAREPVHTRSVGKWQAYTPWLGALASL